MTQDVRHLTLDASGLDEADLASPRMLDAGDTLVRRGETDGDAFLVHSGMLEVIGADGTAVATIGPGELVGEYVALVGGERTATVRAAVATTVQPQRGIMANP